MIHSVVSKFYNINNILLSDYYLPTVKSVCWLLLSIDELKEEFGSTVDKMLTKATNFEQVKHKEYCMSKIECDFLKTTKEKLQEFLNLKLVKPDNEAKTLTLYKSIEILIKRWTSYTSQGTVYKTNYRNEDEEHLEIVEISSGSQSSSSKKKYRESSRHKKSTKNKRKKSRGRSREDSEDSLSPRQHERSSPSRRSPTRYRHRGENETRSRSPKRTSRHKSRSRSRNRKRHRKSRDRKRSRSRDRKRSRSRDKSSYKSHRHNEEILEPSQSSEFEIELRRLIEEREKLAQKINDSKAATCPEPEHPVDETPKRLSEMSGDNLCNDQTMYDTQSGSTTNGFDAPARDYNAIEESPPDEIITPEDLDWIVVSLQLLTSWDYQHLSNSDYRQN